MRSAQGAEGGREWGRCARGARLVPGCLPNHWTRDALCAGGRWGGLGPGASWQVDSRATSELCLVPVVCCGVEVAQGG
eukprot:5102418-Lingulodinium_polyedra.AAC.1